MNPALLDRLMKDKTIRCADVRVSVAREPGAGRVTKIEVLLDSRPRHEPCRAPHVMIHTLKASHFAPEDFLDWLDKTLELYRIETGSDVKIEIQKPGRLIDRWNGQRSVSRRVARNCKLIVAHAFEQHAKRAQRMTAKAA
jgi:hypothetical protein